MKPVFKIFVILFAVFSLQSCIVSQHPNIAFFDNPYYNYGDAEFVSVNVPIGLAKPFVKKALRDDGESEELISLIKKVKKVKVLTIQNGEPEMLKDFNKYLQSNNYQEWMSVKQDNQNIEIQALQKNDVITKLMLTVKSDKEFVLVDIKGKFTPEDLSNLINMAQKKEIKSIVANAESKNKN